MKLRNKKTGKVIDTMEWTFFCDSGAITIENDEDTDKEFRYKSLAEVNKEWEDYKPAEPLIEKESHRGVLRAAARMSGTDTAHVCKSDYAEVVIFEFKGKELCSVELMDKGINTAHDGWYTIDELCGEEEE